LIAHADDDIVRLEAGLGGGFVGLGVIDDQAKALGQLQV
jgi:hypothetical protein